MPGRRDDEFTLPRLILCEGPEDVCFFRSLIAVRQLTNWHIRHTGLNRHERGGSEKFADKIRALRVPRNGFKERVARIVIVRDADSDPEASFLSAQNQLTSVGFPVPANPNELITGTPSVAILMMPMDGPGNLECVCQEAAGRIAPGIAALVDQFADNVGNGWPPHQRGKLWLRAMIAARWQRDPFINLGPLFTSQGNPTVIPLQDPSFNPLANLLEQWAA